MKEILPGIFHWRTLHEGIGEYVHSYYCCAGDPAFLIDPRVPAQGLEWFTDRPPPKHIYLTNRHHYRHSDQFMGRFNSKIWCHEAGLYYFSKEQKVHGFGHGKQLPDGLRALEVGVLCPEETAFFLPYAGGALSIGDAIIRSGGRLGFVPDFLLGEEPEAVKKGLMRIFTHHLELEFAHLLLAHGAPILDRGKKELSRFVQGIS
jgi:hypothetical protein